jgi:hypothetical protein
MQKDGGKMKQWWYGWETGDVISPPIVYGLPARN